MFKLISKIDNVRDYVIYKGKPYYINTSDEIQCGEKKQMLYKTPLSPLATFNGKFYCSEWENNYKIFDENLELIEEGKDKAFLYLSKEFLETYFLDEQQKIFITALLDREENLMVLGDIDRSAISVFSNEYIYIYILMIKHLSEPFLFKRKNIFGSFLFLLLVKVKITIQMKNLTMK